MKTICTPIQKPAFSYHFPHFKESVAFFDIETTGLSPNASSLYLIGLMYYDSSVHEWKLLQWFADNYQSEKEMLQSFLETLEHFTYLYHFNGKTFDIPYITKKCSRHSVLLSEHCEKLLHDTTGEYSIDLLGRIRSLRHTLMLEKCNQTAVEQWLGIQRTDTFTGGELISVYSEYMQQKILNPASAEALEKVLLLHNHDDIEMMLTICSLLTYDEYLSDNCRTHMLSDEALTDLKVTFIDKDSIELLLPLKTAVPKPLHLSACYPASSFEPPAAASTGTMPQNAQLSLRGKQARFLFPLYRGTVKYFLPNPKEYYYLLQEDTAIHKSIAEFVDSTVRKKATAATCYIKKEGVFLPNLVSVSKRKSADNSDTSENELPLFYLQYKDKLSFFELPKQPEQNPEFWKNFLRKQIPAFRS